MAPAAFSLVLLVASVALFKVSRRWYVPTCVGLAFAFIGIGWLDGLSWAEMGLSAAAAPKGALVGLACIGAMALVFGLGLAWPRLHGLFSDKRIQELTGRNILYKSVVEVPLGTVLVEEIAFRGVLIGLLAASVPMWPALLMSSVLFGLWHILPALEMAESHDLAGKLGDGRRAAVLSVVGTVAATACAGLLFGALRVWTGSVLAPMGLHWAMNGLGAPAAWHIGRRQSGDS